MSQEHHGVLTTVWREAHSDNSALATWLERHNVIYERLLAIVLPLALLAVAALLCIGWISDEL